MIGRAEKLQDMECKVAITRSDEEVGMQLQANMHNKVLSILQKHKYCHGDLRPCNIFVRSDGTVSILDFDWAGICGTATYPLFFNHCDITWPDGVEDGALITSEHDKY